jgi:peptidoglycan hydrolase-like protein with peptidoglycan-binding domain
MKKYLLITAVMFFSFYMFGCGKKQTAMEESQEPMSMEAMSAIGTNAQTAPEPKAAESKVETAQPSPVSQAKLEPLPPTGPYKPKATEIQTALKNAGFYNGPIDGKIGPKTKTAIEEFQKANGLKVDGKVGTKTWAILSKHLNPVPVSSKPTKR